MPSSEGERAAVQQQLEKLLGTSLFNSSKRYPSFLKYVVTRTLAGQTDQLKERILGVEVFGRATDYDTNIDPIVRVTAAEIRKRIEQYYQDPKHSQEIRLFLPSGSYVPLFSWPGHPLGLPVGPLDAVGVAADTSVLPPVSAVPALPRSRLSVLAGRRAVVAMALLAVAAAATVSWYFARPSVVKQFWEPFVKSSEPVLFCIADQSQYSTIRLRDAADPQRQVTLNDSMVTIIIDDVSPLVNIAGLLRTLGKTYRVQGESSTSLTDLRHGPSVFIGAYDNGWTLRLTSPLRFHFANNPDMTQFWIEDRDNPAKRDWILYRSVQQQTGTYKDYAIVARVVDPNSDQYVVVAAGIGRDGTIAAGEFLVDAHRMNDMLSQVPGNWKQKNVEIVLETQVIQGRSGPPRISAVHVW
ncbi:MAG TPA: hypothetical protein VK525_06815 [Candidatus Saccharimonadales bacterium]|nr:hypothetical protein [Candidatus Saccharimonadales bacterium]